MKERIRYRGNLILDFTHVYLDEHVKNDSSFHWIDCSDIEETDMYCSDKAYNEIWTRIEPYGIHGIHFIDSGNYHYVTKIMTDHIYEPFSLVLYDHHTDMQAPMAEGMMSCGDWAAQAVACNKYLCQFILVGPVDRDIDNIDNATGKKVITFSEKEINNKRAGEKLNLVRRDLPVYISIDKDVLSEEYTETNWDQGKMTLGMLEQLLGVFESSRILGVDICGECETDIPLPDYLQAEEKNGRTNKELFDYLAGIYEVSTNE